MEPKGRKLPLLRRETVLPPGVPWKRLPAQGWYRGVCAGVGRRIGWKPWRVRLLFLAVPVLSWIYYLLAMKLVPAETSDGPP